MLTQYLRRTTMNKTEIDWIEVGGLLKEVKSYGSFGHSKAFALRIDMAQALEEESNFFGALEMRREAYIILCLFYRRRKINR